MPDEGQHFAPDRFTPANHEPATLRAWLGAVVAWATGLAGSPTKAAQRLGSPRASTLLRHLGEQPRSYIISAKTIGKVVAKARELAKEAGSPPPGGPPLEMDRTATMEALLRRIADATEKLVTAAENRRAIARRTKEPPRSKKAASSAEKDSAA